MVFLWLVLNALDLGESSLGFEILSDWKVVRREVYLVLSLPVLSASRLDVRRCACPHAESLRFLLV